MSNKTQMQSALSGFIASLATTVFYPLEMIKVQMMASDKFSKNFIPLYQNPIHAIRSFYSSSGFLSLYRGCHISLLSGVAWSAYFAFYERAKLHYSDDFKESHKELFRFLVASEAAILSRLATSPMWVVKTRVMLQNQSSTWYGETWEAIIKIWRVDGFRGFFAGMIPGLILCSNGAFQLFFYEILKEKFNSNNSLVIAGASGGGSKLIATSLLYPMQTVMIRLQQEQYTNYIKKKSTDVGYTQRGKRIFAGTMDCILKSYNQQGIKSFYRGFTMQLLRIVPSNALFFVVYEKTLLLLANNNILNR